MMIYSLLRIFSEVVSEGIIKEKLRLMIFKFREFVPKELLLNKGDCAIQVGTPNVKTVQRLSKSIGKRGKAIVVEPEHRNFRKLSEYVNMHHLTNVFLVNKAAWSSKGRLKLLIASKSADHKLEQDDIIHDNDLISGGYVSKELVDVDTIDNIVQGFMIEKIDFIDITVNGAELNVLQGMKNVLGFTERLFVKGHARFKKGGKAINEEITSFLRNKGFRTLITKRSSSVVENVWGKREGDVYAWKVR